MQSGESKSVTSNVILFMPWSCLFRGNSVAEYKNFPTHFFKIIKFSCITECFYAIIAIKHDFLRHSHLPGPSVRVKNLGLRPRDLANVNAWKTMFDPYIKKMSDKCHKRSLKTYEQRREKTCLMAYANNEGADQSVQSDQWLCNSLPR